MVRRRCHRCHDLCCEGGRRPSERGIRKRLGASPHREGELWGDSTAEGVHLGSLRELRVEVWDLAPQVARAVLDGAGNLGIAAVAIDDPAAWQPGLAEDVWRHAGRPGRPAPEQAAPGGSEQPGIAMVPMRPPSGFVGMLHGRLAVVLKQPLRNASTEARHAVEDLHHAAWAQGRLFAHCASRDAVQVGPRGRRRHPLVTLETLGPDGRGPWLEGPTAAGAIRLGQAGEDACGLDRATFEASPASHPLVFHACVAVRAALARCWRHVDHPFGWTGVNGVSPHPGGPRPGAFPREELRWRDVGVDRQRGGGGGRAEKARQGLPLRVAELLPKALECLGARIDLPLFLQTLRPPIDGPHHSRHSTSGQRPVHKRAAPGGNAGVQRWRGHMSDARVVGGHQELKQTLQGASQAGPGAPLMG